MAKKAAAKRSNKSRRASSPQSRAPKAKSDKHVYFFGNGKADGNRHMKDLLGGKGSGLAEMTNAGLPVPPGFTISTEVCTIYYKQKGKISAGHRSRDRGEPQEAREGRRRRRSARPTTRCSSRSGRARSSRCPA